GGASGPTLHRFPCAPREIPDLLRIVAELRSVTHEVHLLDEPGDHALALRVAVALRERLVQGLLDESGRLFLGDPLLPGLVEVAQRRAALTAHGCASEGDMRATQEEEP